MGTKLACLIYDVRLVNGIYLCPIKHPQGGTSAGMVSCCVGETPTADEKGEPSPWTFEEFKKYKISYLTSLAICAMIIVRDGS